MLILFDQSTPAPLRHVLKPHIVVEAVERGWEALDNGALLEAAEAEAFEILVTADKNMRYQQTSPGGKLLSSSLETPSGPYCVAMSKGSLQP